ncbi:hypothetical protein F53441_7182 [Fusarium austroafricanum]|uniref:Uncharacterized protein n=1 Tax=Fusarium austroafricanum TaxID=2364996 RepID=A0A8H4KGA4_9HYPO|nr:hypothetical protein F53441_7182 [Fusarium austroafricanum]
MDRDRSSLGERSSQLIVKQSGRKPLFTSNIPRGSDRNKENDQAQQTNSRLRSSIQSNGFVRSANSDLDRRESIGSTGSRDSKLPTPRFSSSTRKRLSMQDAFAMAQKEAEEDSDGNQVVDASPSPAPRVWRQRHEEEGNQMRQALNHDHLDTKAPSRPFSRESIASRIPELKKTPAKSESPRQRSFYGKSRAGLSFTPREPREPTPESNTPAGAPPAPALVNGVRAETRPESRTGTVRTGSNWLRHMPSKDDLTKQGRIPALVPGIEDILPSVEGPETQNEPVNSQPAGPASPEKSFAWQVDDDFTAGELQVSDSPRLRFGARPFANRIHFDEGSEIDINSRTRVAPPGARNTKLDEIRSREVKTGSDIPLEPRHNTKIDEIREREERVEHQIPIPDRNAPRPRNTKLDEIRQREVNGIPRRSMASIRLEEIREQNAMSRSRSPEENRPKTSQGMIPETRPTTEIETKEPPPRPKSAFEMAGERIPDTPVTIYKSRRESVESNPKEDSNSKDEADRVRPGLSYTRNDSQDVLRRLARAASSSPAPEPEPRQLADTDKPASLPLDPKPDTTSAIPQPATSNGFRNRQHRSNRDFSPKPTVTFAGLSRNRSTESVKSKKSMEADPTDRIAAEANLFAPGDNQSEKGSVRAPSPEPADADDEKDLEATPRAPKPDPLTMPTPKVTGAYVETPATVRVEKIELKDKQEKPKREERPLRQRSASLRDKRTDRAMSGSDRDTASDPGTDDKPSTRTSSSGVRRRRTRSLSRRRGTLTNSAKLPTVKDDLKELQRVHYIEDSTLDDLEEVLLGRKAPSQEVEALLDKLPENTSLDDSYDFDLELDTKLNTRTNQINPENNDNSDLDRMTRMNNTLKSSLYGIHTAARGIERLSDQVNTKNKAAENKSTELMTPKEEPLENNLLDIIKPEPLPEKMSTLHDSHGAGTAFITHCDSKSVSYLSIPVPDLYRRKPFRFTLLGLGIFLVVLWFTLESSMCAMFCRPTRCGSTPCVWSIDDPTFGNAIPVKLDQWTTGGRGRILAGQLKEEMDDWFADMMDLVLDRKITDVDIQGLSFEQKRQHRRRLRKKGLVKRRVETPEQRAKWEAWQRAQREQERQKELREMGYEIQEDDDETIGGDTRVW